MSDIDKYHHTCLGVIECPVPVYWPKFLYVAIYHLEQDIPEIEEAFQGHKGDIVVGGGSGESPAMTIRVPDAFSWSINTELLDDDHLFFNDRDKSNYPIQVFWTPTEAYSYGLAYSTFGWNPSRAGLEHWLTSHVITFLHTNHTDRFSFLKSFPSLRETELVFSEDGTICRSLTDDEEKIYNWRKYRT